MERDASMCIGGTRPPPHQPQVLGEHGIDELSDPHPQVLTSLGCESDKWKWKTDNTGYGTEPQVNLVEYAMNPALEGAYVAWAHTRVPLLSKTWMGSITQNTA